MPKFVIGMIFDKLVSKPDFILEGNKLILNIGEKVHVSTS
jgi:hypothetical protein